MTLKQDERRYAMERVYEIKKRLIDDAREACTKKGTKITDKQIMQAIRDGDVELKTYRIRWNLNTPVRECIDYEHLETEDVLDEQKFKTKKRSIEHEAGKITDAIMLLNGADVANLIKKFESRKP